MAEASAQQCAAVAQGGDRRGVESMGKLAFASLGEFVALASQAAPRVSRD
ncbi:hypothetical protein L1080_034845 [Rhodococcus sp. MSC1_016]|nr:hypothetical protein [Rhodococcus sp. MSC1_016]